MEPQQPTGGRKNLISIILAVLLIASLVFGGWAFSKGQDYKNNSDKKSAAAVAAANKQLTAQLQAQFDQQNKSPNKTFQGSPTYGSITFNYPKTWSAYVDTSNSSEPINAYFNPGEVPGVNSTASYALRVELLSSDYSQITQQLSSSISSGLITSKAYIPPKLSGVANVPAGLYLTGKISQQNAAQQGYMLAIKVRDKTLEIYTESPDYQADFNNIILSSLTFAP